MKSNNILIILVLVVGALLVILVAGKKKGWFGKPDGIKVAVEKPERRDIIETVTANGKIQPETEVKISPDVSGEIVELHINEGEFVEKGKLLLKIKPDTYISIRDRAKASLNSAEARLAQANAQYYKAELDYNRNKTLWDKETISKAEFEQIESNYKIAQAEVKAAEFSVKSAQASLDEAKENLIKTSIYAPISGTVSMLNVELGERVVGTSMMTGTELLRIADLNRMEVKVEVNENDIVKVALNDTAIIEVDAYLDYKFKGIVTEIANSANITGMNVDQVTNFNVKILLLHESYQELITDENPNPFRPGMSATADIQTEYKYNTLSIPIMAVTTRVDSILYKEDSLVEQNKEIKGDLLEVLLVVENGKSKIIEVTTGIQDSEYIEILTNIPDSTEVVVAPYAAIAKKLKDNSPIIIVEEDELYEKN